MAKGAAPMGDSFVDVQTFVRTIANEVGGGVVGGMEMDAGRQAGRQVLGNPDRSSHATSTHPITRTHMHSSTTRRRGTM